MEFARIKLAGRDYKELEEICSHIRDIAKKAFRRNIRVQEEELDDFSCYDDIDTWSDYLD